MDPNWVMVIITGVYVVATIFICIANFKSANASKKQLEEMQKQYAEDNRPYVEAELHYEQRVWYILRFVNHGNHTAQHFKVHLKQTFIDSLPDPSFKRIIEKQKDKECIIGVGQHYDLYIGSNALRKNKNWEPLVGKITYQAKGKTYEDDIYIDIENYMTFFSTNTEQEDIIKQLKEAKDALRLINNSIKSININQKEENKDA